jgi:hypothetical protein
MKKGNKEIEKVEKIKNRKREKRKEIKWRDRRLENKGNFYDYGFLECNAV